MNKYQRTAIGALALSATGLVHIAMQEGYREVAYIPVPGDVPTIGFGTTEGVKLGDKITPPKALQRSLADIGKYEGSIKACVKVPLYQREYDAYTSLSYNIGTGAFCGSTLVKKLNTGNYTGACESILAYQCGPASKQNAAKPGEPCYRADGKPRMVLRGLVKRRQAEYRMCVGPQA